MRTIFKVTLLSLLAVFAVSSYSPAVFNQDLYAHEAPGLISVKEEGDEVVEGEEAEEVIVENINSYELFWPLVAGKTSNESLYFLKRFKEKIRGALIFGNAQKAEYESMLATKRLLEVEKLLGEGNEDEARDTLEQASERLSEVKEEWDDVDDKGSVAKDQKDEINNKLNNLEVFLPYLIRNNESLQSELGDVLTQVHQINETI